MSYHEPVKCRCGGESECLRYEISKGYSDSGTWFYVYCVDCGIHTIDYHTMEEAIEAWNRVMEDRIERKEL